MSVGVGRGLGEGLAGDVRLDVDHTRDRHGRAHAHLRRVDGAGEAVNGEGAVVLDLHADEQLVRTEVLGAQVDDPPHRVGALEALDDLAEIGLCFALGGVLLSAATHNPRWDAGASILIGLLLVAIAGILAVEMRGC